MLEVPDVDFIRPFVGVVFVLFSFIADWNWVVVSVILVVCSLCFFIYMCLFVMVNCLLNVFSICVGEVNGFFFEC